MGVAGAANAQAEPTEEERLQQEGFSCDICPTERRALDQYCSAHVPLLIPPPSLYWDRR
jgi:hypothetical protein